MIDKEFKVLDNGYVKLVDVMGSDEAIASTASISYGKEAAKNTKALIRHLMKNGHTTPFEMCELKFKVRVPMDCWRQWIRHRTANVNERSTRYTKALPLMQKATEWRTAGGKRLDKETIKELTEREKKLHDLLTEEYMFRLKCGVVKEQARKDLPLSQYTEAYWKMDLHNLLNFLRLRMHKDAQFEIRQYANIIGKKIVAKQFPLTWEAFSFFVFNS